MFHTSPEFALGQVLGVFNEDYEKQYSQLKYSRIRRKFNFYLEQVGKSSVIQVLMPEFIKKVHLFIPHVKTVCIPNAVNQKEKMMNLDSHTIINVARVVPVKRQHLLVEAFNLLKNRYPNWNVEIWGQTNDPYSQIVQSCIEKYNLSNRVKMCGITTNIDKCFDHSSILIMPSSIEGFCLGVAEAMTRGLPVIGCKSCVGINSLIRNGKNGFLCEDTPESLAGALEILMENKSLRLKFGQQGWEDAKAFDPKNIWKKWNELILEVIGGKS